MEPGVRTDRACEAAMNRTTVMFAMLATAIAAPSFADEIAAAGDAVPQLSGFDDWMKSFMAEHNIPGGQLAIVRQGKLVYARGFGWADRDAKEPVEPQSLFRIASVSKPITAVAILKLADQGKLKLSDK